ncbi:hypothetical protein [Nostoc sp. TCL26-01]|uniref:hypothetical protein n=1 Tax=Nostoc sp. TCL26-01 TaxID=2576904 RepID=UPI0015BF8E73|nr:hypothetical protein [Nostoc sp. TCL26-01]QLE54145.1 hypothetical protein FD725_00550 [Nostoc sp. TCL26-01]
MKNKFLAIVAVGAALGAAVVSAPANAQVTQGNGPSKDITVNITVPEILFLRTIDVADVDITAAELAGSGVTLTQVGTTDTYIGSDQTTTSPGTTTVNTASPFVLPTGGALAKTIASAYVVWSNSPTGTYEVAITPPSAGFSSTVGTTTNTLTGVSVTAGAGQKTATGLTTAPAQDITLSIPLDGSTKAGTYSGLLKVEAYRP